MFPRTETIRQDCPKENRERLELGWSALRQDRNGSCRARWIWTVPTSPQNLTVRPPDLHGFDADGDEVGGVLRVIGKVPRSAAQEPVALAG
jgi:hypothetical protein